MQKHEWSFNDDKVVCQAYIKYYLMGVGNIQIDDVIDILSEELPYIKESSLKMKLQNIKSMLKKYKVKDSFPGSGLSSYSYQCEKAFKEALKEYKK